MLNLRDKFSHNKKYPKLEKGKSQKIPPEAVHVRTLPPHPQYVYVAVHRGEIRAEYFIFNLTVNIFIIALYIPTHNALIKPDTNYPTQARDNLSIDYH